MRIVLVAIATMVTYAAMAQESGTTVSVGPWFETLRPYILEVLGMAVAAIIGLLSRLIYKKWGIDIEQGRRDALHSAAMTGLKAALSRAGVKAADVQFDVRHKVIAEALDWMRKSVPDAIKYFGISEQGMKTLVEAKHTELVEATAGAAAAVMKPVEEVAEALAANAPPPPVVRK